MNRAPHKIEQHQLSDNGDLLFSSLSLMRSIFSLSRFRRLNERRDTISSSNGILNTVRAAWVRTYAKAVASSVGSGWYAIPVTIAFSRGKRFRRASAHSVETPAPNECPTIQIGMGRCSLSSRPSTISSKSPRTSLTNERAHNNIPRWPLPNITPSSASPSVPRSDPRNGAGNINESDNTSYTCWVPRIERTISRPSPCEAFRVNKK
mmetsp:Transcript_34703/g.55564  ORF Transcript_34703/g.55564 Transcript_34703/m.55564 type:complete len:207 (+) Transcript_34703:714-1334(+)